MADTPEMTAQEFRLMRGHLGLTVQWVADQLGISHVAVVHWESGRVTLPDYAVDAMRKWLQDARVYAEWIALANANSPLQIRECKCADAQVSVRSQIRVCKVCSTNSRLLAIPADHLAWQATAPAALRHYPLAWAHRVAARAIEHRWVHGSNPPEEAAGGPPCDADADVNT